MIIDGSGIGVLAPSRNGGKTTVIVFGLMIAPTVFDAAVRTG
jgi:hypothetical protein